MTSLSALLVEEKSKPAKPDPATPNTNWAASAGPNLERAAIRHTIAQNSQGVLLICPNGEATYVNSAFEKITGYEATDFRGRGFSLLQGPQTNAEMAAKLRKAIESQKPFFGELLNYKKDNSSFWNELSVNPVFGHDGGFIHFVGVMRDVTERNLNQAQLKLASQVFAQGKSGMMVMDENHKIILVNKAFTDITGYLQADVVGKENRMFSSGRQEDSFYQNKWRTIEATGHWEGEVWHRRKDGSEFLSELTINAMRDDQGKVCNHIGTFTDVSEKLATRDRIQWLWHYDVLTNLPNRALFKERLGMEITRAERTGKQVAVLLLDIDHFKEINDTLGHDQGDNLLVVAAQRLRLSVPEIDTLARLGGDEFVAILSNVTDVEQVNAFGHKLIDTLATPFNLDSGPCYVSASIGIALYPNDATSVKSLLRSADQAMYAAKDSGRNCIQFFTPELQHKANSRLWLSNELRGALPGHQFWLAYQPIVDLKTGSIRKAEALIRWNHPERGLISPAEFIPVAEASGMIVEIGEWVFQTAAAQVMQIRKTHDPEFQISVNKSPAQFHHRDTSKETWFQQLTAQGLSCQSIMVEITEGLLLEASQRVEEQLLALRQAGIQIALDDFGTGYSSLAYLQKHDIDYVKIDQSFVRNLSAGSKESTLCDAIIAMAHKLDIQVVAEGIETPEQLELLQASGCDYGQGYLFARPMPAKDFEAFLSASLLINPTTIKGFART